MGGRGGDARAGANLGNALNKTGKTAEGLAYIFKDKLPPALRRSVGQISAVNVKFGRLAWAINLAIVAFKGFDSELGKYQRDFKGTFSAVASGGLAFKKGLSSYTDDLIISGKQLKQWGMTLQDANVAQRELLSTRQRGLAEALGGGLGPLAGIGNRPTTGFGSLMDRIQRNLVSQTGLKGDVFTKLIADELRMGVRGEGKTVIKTFLDDITSKDGLFGVLNYHAYKTGQDFERLAVLVNATTKELRPLGLNTEEAADRILKYSKLVYQGVLTQQQAINLAGGFGQRASMNELFQTAMLAGMDLQGDRGGLFQMGGALSAVMSGSKRGLSLLGGGQKAEIDTMLKGLIGRAEQFAGPGALGQAMFLRENTAPFKGMTMDQVLASMEAIQQGGGIQDVAKMLQKDAQAKRELEKAETLWVKNRETYMSAIDRNVAVIAAHFRRGMFGGDNLLRLEEMKKGVAEAGVKALETGDRAKAGAEMMKYLSLSIPFVGEAVSMSQHPALKGLVNKGVDKIPDVVTNSVVSSGVAALNKIANVMDVTSKNNNAFQNWVSGSGGQ
jgi:hypothetical protein